MYAEYLLDASAIYPLLLELRERFIDYAHKFSVLDLTIYEVGNTLLKEFKRGRISNLRAIAELFNEIFSYVNIIRTHIDIPKIVELALNENLTFYDASYIYTARQLGIKLVTDDKDLLRFPESINTQTLIEILTQEGEESR